MRDLQQELIVLHPSIHKNGYRPLLGPLCNVLGKGGQVD